MAGAAAGDRGENPGTTSCASTFSEALALESGLSRNMVIGIEWGRKSLAYERLWDVADLLGVPVTDLFTAAVSSPLSRRSAANGQQ